jgi:hypothetical protein
VEFGRYHRGLTIKHTAGGKFFYSEYNSKNMGMSAEQYISLITSSKKVNLNELSEIDQKGISAGQALVGMSKKGIRIALGYPAAD